MGIIKSGLDKIWDSKLASIGNYPNWTRCGRMGPEGLTYFFTFFAIIDVMEFKFCKINMFIIPKWTISELLIGAQVHFSLVNSEKTRKKKKKCYSISHISRWFLVILQAVLRVSVLTGYHFCSRLVWISVSSSST